MQAILQLRSALGIIWKRRWSCFTFLLIVITVVSIYTFGKEPIYKATALLRINKDDLKVFSFEEFVASDESTDELIKTEVEVIRSRALAEKVATVLNLAADANFQKELRPGPIGSVMAMLRGKSAENADLSDERRRAAVAARLLEMIDISPIRGSRLVRLSVFARSAPLAAEIANTWSELYIKQGIEQKMAASRLASQELAEQIERQKEHVESVEKKLYAYSREHGIYSYDDMKENLEQRLSELNSLLTKAEADLIRKRVALTSMQADPLGSEVAIKDPVVQKLREQVANLESEYSDLLKTFKPEYPECIRLRARIEEISKSIQQQTRKWLSAAATDYAAAQEQVRSLQDEIEKLQAQTMAMQDAAVDYKTLERELKSSTEHYQALLARRKEALSSMQIRASKVNVVDRAKVPAAPHSPRPALNLILALVLGTSLACAVSLLLEYTDNSVRTADDVEHEIGEALLGVVPEIEEDDELGYENRDLISHLDGKSTVSEAYRTIRTSLAFSSREGETKNIVISSAVPGEGKTITAINIATVLGQAGEQVLLIDADMRRPRLHRSLHLPNDRGLSTLLVGRCGLDDVIMPTCLPNVDIIVSGPTPSNPSELLSDDRMTELLQECRKRYDRVIIDTPPAMAVTDCRLTAAKADGLIHVIRAGKTEKRCVKMAKKHFEGAGTRVIGAVLNDVAPQSGHHEHYYYYYYSPYTN